MISYLWPEGMMQYTVVGAEATAADPNDRPDLVFKTSDGYITAGTISDSEWQGFCRASGDPELAKDPRFATPSARSVNATARINKMAEYIAQHTTAEWLERLDAADVPCAPILRRGEIIDNEQVVARDIIAEFDQPMVGRVRQPKPAARFEINKAAIGGPAPRVGEHSREVSARSRLRRRRDRQDGQRKIGAGRGLDAIRKVGTFSSDTRNACAEIMPCCRPSARNVAPAGCSPPWRAVGLSRLDAFEIGMRVVANADAVSDRPIQTGRQQDVGAGELVAHQELPAVGERDLDMTQLLPKILAGLGDDLRCDAVDRTERVGPVPAHDIQAGGVEFGDDEKAPFQPGGVVALGLRDQGALRRRIGSRQIGDDRRTFADAEIAILQQRYFLTRVERGVFGGLGFSGARADRDVL